MPFAIHPTFEPQWTKGTRMGAWEHVRELRLLASVTASDGVRHQFTTLFDYGVFDRFPRSGVIVLESGGGWIGYWLDRIDAVYAHTFIGRTVPLEHKPSDYFRERIWISCDPDERTIPALAERFGADRFLWASDFPTPTTRPSTGPPRGAGRRPPGPRRPGPAPRPQREGRGARRRPGPKDEPGPAAKRGSPVGSPDGSGASTASPEGSDAGARRTRRRAPSASRRPPVGALRPSGGRRGGGGGSHGGGVDRVPLGGLRGARAAREDPQGRRGRADGREQPEPLSVRGPRRRPAVTDRR